MNRKVSYIILFILCFSFLFAAEVSKKKEIAVLPVFSSYELPTGAAMYFDDVMIGTLSKMGRFEVIGYQYRLDYNSAEKFIQKIQELKKQALMKNPQYMDVDLGVVVIPANEMERLVNSFFIFVPSITGFHTRQYQVEVKAKDARGKIRVKFVTEYEAIVNVSIKIITAEGKLMDTYNSSQKSTSQNNMMEAYQSAINSAISGLSFFLRNVEEFKIKSQIVDIKGGDVYIELGGNIGIRPGYEFIIQREEKVMDKFTDKVTVGLLRTKEIRNEYSIASVISGNPIVGDQVVEAPLTGGRFNLWLGAMPMNVPSDTLVIKYAGLFESKEKFSKSSYAFALGIDLESEIGYAFLLDLALGLYINNPFAFNFDVGLGYEFYLGMFSFTAGLDFSIVGIYKYLGRLDNNSYYGISIEGTKFYEDIDVSLEGGTFGLKPKLTFNYQPTQRFKVRAFGGFALYFLPVYWLRFEEVTSDEDKSSTTVDVSDPDVGFYVDESKVADFPINFSGFFGGIEFIFRF